MTTARGTPPGSFFISNILGLKFLLWLYVPFLAFELAAADSVDLLQRHLEIHTPSSVRRMKASPMHWLHVPKCGSSFFNALMHMPGACPGVEENVSVNDERFGPCWIAGVRTKCPEMCDQRFVCCTWQLKFMNGCHLRSTTNTRATW